MRTTLALPLLALALAAPPPPRPALRSAATHGPDITLHYAPTIARCAWKRAGHHE
jgi:hypothetical protein